jgi:hypothetical protein
MKKHLFLFVCFILTITACFAQKKEGKNYEKIKTLKINYISSELNLTPEQASKFWPVFNEYEKENWKLRSTKIKNIKTEIEQNGNIESLTDEKANELSAKIIKISDKYAANKSITFDKLGTILSPQQLLKLHFTEMEFNRKVLRKLHQEKK